MLEDAIVNAVKGIVVDKFAVVVGAIVQIKAHKASSDGVQGIILNRERWVREGQCHRSEIARGNIGGRGDIGDVGLEPGQLHRRRSGKQRDISWGECRPSERYFC